VNLSLQEALWQRVGQLDESARRFMECVALAGAPMKFQVIAGAAGIEVAKSLELMSGLRIGQMVRVIRQGEARLVEPYHDRMREAILAHLQADTAAGEPGDSNITITRLHLAIGKKLLEATRDDSLEAELFTIVRHLMRGASLLESSAERRQLIALTLRAAQKARLKTAYEPALEHVAQAEALLADDDPRDLRFALARERVELYWLSGRNDDALRLFAAALDGAQSDCERVELYELRITMEKLRGESQRAIATGCEGLRRFGVNLDERPGLRTILRELSVVRWRQGLRPLDALAFLPDCRDERAGCAMRLLAAMTAAAYYVDSTLLSAVLLKIVSMSLKHGMCEHSAFGFVGYGLLMSGGLGRYRTGFALGELALRLNERFGGGAVRPQIEYLFGAFLTAWVRPFAHAAMYLERASDESLHFGDLEYRLRALSSHAIMLELSAARVDEILTANAQAVELARQRRDDDLFAANTLRQRLYRSLQTPRANPTDLTDPPLELQGALSDEKMPLAMGALHQYSAIACYYFGEFEEARRHMIEAEKRENRLFAMLALVNRSLFRVLIAAELYHGGRREEQRRCRRWIKQGISRLRRWSAECPENFLSRYRLAQAEAARAFGHDRAARAHYRGAVEEARRNGASGVEALALELAARHARTRGHLARAAEHLEGAIAAYERWGAAAKVAQLRAATRPHSE
jgi:hypothetical protein